MKMTELNESEQEYVQEQLNKVYKNDYFCQT